MELKFNNNDEQTDFLKKLFFLAYEACDESAGMGIFQARDKVTEEDVYDNVINSGDYPMSINDDSRIYADYVFGRMMKLSVELKGNSIIIPDSTPRVSYQAWSGKYKDYKSLVRATKKELSGISASAVGI